MKTRTTLLQKAHSLNMTEPEYLRYLITQHRKLTSMAAEAGFSHVCILRRLQFHGITKPHARSFEFGGVVAGLKSHCHRLGLEMKNVTQARARHEFSTVEAIQYSLQRKYRHVCKTI